MTDTITVPTARPDEVPDFGTPEGQVVHPIPFKINGNLYYGSPEQPAGMLFDMAKMINSNDMASQLQLLSNFLESMLVPESWARLQADMRVPGNKITIQSLLKATQYVTEQVTGRPTTQSSSSSAGQPGTGSTSTGTAPTTG